MKLRVGIVSNVAIIALAALLSACASPIRTEPVIADGQQQIFRDGLPALLSRKQYVVMVSPQATIRQSNERASFVVSVANTSDSAFDLDTTSFSAAVDGRDLKVFTHDEIAKEIRTRQAWAAFAVALGGAMQAAAAQQQASTTSTFGTYNSSTAGSFNTYGTRGATYGSFNANTIGTYSGWTYNPAAGQAAAAAVNARTSADIDRIQLQGQAALTEASRAMLKQTTVFPQTSYGGQIVLGQFDVPESGATLEIVANIRGEVHRFSFTQRRASR